MLQGEGNRSKWKNNNNNKKRNIHRSLLLTAISFPTLVCIILIFSSLPKSPFLSSSHLAQTPTQCCAKSSPLLTSEKFLWYGPHSGFSNQLSEFKNAIIMSAILNRTLVVPPILDHHAVALGSCPKFRVLNPTQLRVQVWDHAIHLIRQGRYISMADVIDLSSVATMVQTVDFRYFVSLWCGVDLNSICLDDSDAQASVLNDLRQCGSCLSGLNGNVDNCLYAVDADCRTTVWTYNQNDSDGSLDSFQPDEQLRVKKKLPYVRHRQDVYKHLGPGSEAHLSSLLAFGSLFTAPYKGSQGYIDIHKSLRDNRIQSLLGKLEFLPFVPNIRNAGKEFAQKKIRAPFLCAQLRLLDGQFKNHWNTTFSVFKQKVEAIKQKGFLPVHIFVMTDLPRSNWSRNYLGDLASDASSFKLHFLSKGDEVVRRTAAKVAAAGDIQLSHCPHKLADLLLYIEETVCSCASLGFVGTAGSTIAESIELMRRNNFCFEHNQMAG